MMAFTERIEEAMSLLRELAAEVRELRRLLAEEIAERRERV